MIQSVLGFPVVFIMSLWRNSIGNSRLAAILRENGAVAILGEVEEDDSDRALVLLVAADDATEDGSESSWEVEIVLGALAFTAVAGP